MAKILIGGAGGAPSEGVIRSLQINNKNDEIIGMGSEPTDLVLSAADKKYFIPYADTSGYRDSLLSILEIEKPDLLHFQNDLEIYQASLIREDILSAGTKLFMPDHAVIDTCVHKFKSYAAFKSAGVPVPINIMINNEDELKHAFDVLGDADGKIWLRASSIGGGGKGAIPTNDFALAKGWIDHYDGWGDFCAAEMLMPETVTWLSIWYEGELVVAQARDRKGWTHGNRSISGVTGVTKVGVTSSRSDVSETAMAAVKAVSTKPHGIFGVDMAYDKTGRPCPTEINISRFFTTVLFFTKAGLNMPGIFRDLALDGQSASFHNKIGMLPDGLHWVRGMDTEPRLMTSKSITDEIHFL